LTTTGSRIPRVVFLLYPIDQLLSTPLGILLRL
jgi:hypothetical protein